MGTIVSDLKDGTVEVTGGRMHYVEKGAGDPLILVHGFAPISSWKVWNANIRALSTQRRVIAVDLPGYGDSTGERSTDFGQWFSTYSHAVHDLISALQLAPASLCGLSAGGAACLTLTTKWPAEVDRLVLVDSAGGEAAERWRSIEQPALLVWQQEDAIVPVEQGHKLHEALPNSRLEVLQGNAAGIDPHEWHWSQALNPDRFNELVLEFLG